MVTATVFKSICYYRKMMHNRISGVTITLYLWQDAKQSDPRSNKHTTPVIKLNWMKTDSVEMLWWWWGQYLNPSATTQTFQPFGYHIFKIPKRRIYFVSCSNLRQSLGIMYHMLLHGPMRFWPLWCLFGGFYKGFWSSEETHLSPWKRFFWIYDPKFGTY